MCTLLFTRRWQQNLPYQFWVKLQVKFSIFLVQQKPLKQPNISKCYTSFFHCLNARGLEKNQTKTKPFLKPYTDENGERFSWITNQFLEDLNTWKENNQNRPRDLTQNARSKMFVSLQIYPGMTVCCYHVSWPDFIIMYI